MTALASQVASREAELQEVQQQIERLQRNLQEAQRPLSELKASVAALEAKISAEGLERFQTKRAQRERRREVGESLAKTVRGHELEEARKRRIFALAEAHLRYLADMDSGEGSSSAGVSSSSSSTNLTPASPSSSASSSPSGSDSGVVGGVLTAAEIRSEYLAQRAISTAQSVCGCPLSSCHLSRDLIYLAQNATVELNAGTKQAVLLYNSVVLVQTGGSSRRRAACTEALDLVVALCRGVEDFSTIHRLRQAWSRQTGKEGDDGLLDTLIEVIGDENPLAGLIKSCINLHAETFAKIWMKAFTAVYNVPIVQSPGSWRLEVRVASQRIQVQHRVACHTDGEPDVFVSFEWLLLLTLDPDLFVVTAVDSEILPSSFRAPQQPTVFDFATISAIVKSVVTFLDLEPIFKQLRKFREARAAKTLGQRSKRSDKAT